MKLRTMRKLVLLLMIAAAAAGAVYAPSNAAAVDFQKFSKRELGIFDTEITLIGFAESQEAFDHTADETIALLRDFDRIFDAYKAYEGLNNLYYVNANAAKEPVEIPSPLFDLIAWCKDRWSENLRFTNIAMGAVLSIWHDYRTNGINHPESAALPPMDMLEAASAHIDFDQVVLDQEKQTVFFLDKDLSLDIGAVAKGYAADQASKLLRARMPSFLLSLGGNVYAGEAPLDGRKAWAVGVQDPRADALQVSVGGTDILDIMDVAGLSVVTSGDYWRFYVVDGQRYHHIIDPETLMPSTKMLSVTVICESSSLADFLSTTLFILSYEEGLALVQAMDGVEAMWVLPDGSIKLSPGMGQYARSIQ